MWHFKAPGRLMQGSLAADWGKITSYLEVADDQYAVRQVDVFRNGNVLRYDRSRRRDEYGFLFAAKFSRKPKWVVFFPGAEMISAGEFDQLWQSAQRTDRDVSGRPLIR